MNNRGRTQHKLSAVEKCAARLSTKVAHGKEAYVCALSTKVAHGNERVKRICGLDPSPSHRRTYLLTQQAVKRRAEWDALPELNLTLLGGKTISSQVAGFSPGF